MRLCLAGDAAAWRALVARFTPMVCARVHQTFVPRVGRAPTENEVQEIAQDVFVRLVARQGRLLREFAWRSTLAGYLSGVAAIATLDRIRKEASQRPPDWASLFRALREKVPAKPPPDPAEQAVSEESIHHLREAVAALPARDRLVLELRFWRGADFSAIGRLLGTDAKYARVILTRAVEKLQKSVRP